MAAVWRRNSGLGAALPGAGEVPSASRAPLRVSHQKNGAEPDAMYGRVRSTSPADRSRDSR